MEEKKHNFVERIFWLIAFLLSLFAALYLINQVLLKYHSTPVIVTFQTVEQYTNSIPFPAVTLCNMNKFPKSRVIELERIASDPEHPKNSEAKRQLTFVRSVCNAQESFAKDFGFAFTRGINDTSTSLGQDQGEMMDFLLQNTDQCDQMIRLCILEQKKVDCNDLFRPVITDYGKCCVFNILPLPLLISNPQSRNKVNGSIYENPALGNNGEMNWPMNEIELWKKWNYNDGFLLWSESKMPFRQKSAGLPYGLSILVDPATDEYFCPLSDSEGIRFLLHTPLEMPHVNEHASLIDLNKEILIEVHPDITNADDDIRNIETGHRSCYFAKEIKLKFYEPYTAGNCMDDCTAIVLQIECNCTLFFMSRDNNVKICDNDPDSAEFICVDRARAELQSTHQCSYCVSLCEDIDYKHETTVSTLQNSSQLWKDIRPYHEGIPDWADHKMSILHIFYGSEKIVPKYRKRLYGITDLIANIGGILGLCLGFSILSGVEIVYSLMMRTVFKYCRERNLGRRLFRKFLKQCRAKKDRVIPVNPNSISIYPVYLEYGNFGVP